MNSLLLAFLLSLAPISELRGGLPVALASGNPFIISLLICILANILVFPVVIFFLEFIHHRLLFFKTYRNVAEKFIERTRKKAHKKVEKYGYFGLFLLVAIPLPFTGAYTGTIASWFFGMNKLKSFITITAGIITASILVSIIYYGVLFL